MQFKARTIKFINCKQNLSNSDVYNISICKSAYQPNQNIADVYVYITFVTSKRKQCFNYCRPLKIFLSQLEICITVKHIQYFHYIQKHMMSLSPQAYTLIPYQYNDSTIETSMLFFFKIKAYTIFL